MTNIISDSYYSLVDTLNQLKSLKLKDDQSGDAADCYDAILVNVESLESAGAFKTKHLGYIICVFENTSDSRFHIWASQKYQEVMEFVKKIYCLTKTSCTLMISLTMVYSLKNLCDNTATFLTQSGGNPLILRRVLNMNIYF